MGGWLATLKITPLDKSFSPAVRMGSARFSGRFLELCQNFGRADPTLRIVEARANPSDKTLAQFHSIRCDGGASLNPGQQRWEGTAGRRTSSRARKPPARTSNERQKAGHHPGDRDSE